MILLTLAAGDTRNPPKEMQNWSRIRNYAMLRPFSWRSVVLDDARWPGTQTCSIFCDDAAAN
jgi:hypothetical protein